MKAPRKPSRRTKGAMQVGVPMVIRMVRWVEVEGDLYTVHYWSTYWERWRINAEGAVRVDTHARLMPPDRGTLDLVDAWAYRTHRALAKEKATSNGSSSVA